MRRFNLKKEDIAGEMAYLSREERAHIVNVLRMKKGDTLVASCGDGVDYICEIAEILEDGISLYIKSEIANTSDPKVEITLFVGTPKRDKLEFIVQKATELGGGKIVPFQSSFCIAKFDNDKIARLEKISAEASKQCKRSNHIEICEVRKFDKMVESLSEYDVVFFAYEKETSPFLQAIENFQTSNPNGKIAVVVGSEGGFSEAECEKIKTKENVCCVSLGRRILRMETATVYMLSVLSCMLDN